MDRDSPPELPRPPRRVPRQHRSRSIVESILEAAQQLLTEAGPDALTTNRIAERAGVSIGSLYRYFPDKSAVVEAVVEIAAAREAADLAEAEWEIETVPLPEALEQIVDFQLDRHRRLEEQGGALYRRHHRASSLTRRLGPDLVERRIRALLEAHRDEVRVGDVAQAAYLVARGISAVVRNALEERPEQLHQPGFRAELIALVRRYVLGG